MDELVGLYWTVSGPVEVHAGREWSLFDFRDRCEHAQRVGFSGIGIWHADLEHVLEKYTLAEMRTMLDDHGLTRLELEFLLDWFVDPGDERRTASDAHRATCSSRPPTCSAPTTSRSATSPARRASSSKLTERFAELCADAAQRHDSLIAYEFMPFDVNVQTIEAALAVVGGAGGAQRRDRGRHLALREARDPARGAARGSRRTCSAGSSSPTGSSRTWTTRSTRSSTTAALPGEGEFDIPGYVQGVPGDRLPGPVGRRGPLRGPAQPADRRDLRPGVRDDGGAASRRRAA